MMVFEGRSGKIETGDDGISADDVAGEVCLPRSKYCEGRESNQFAEKAHLFRLEGE